MNYDTILLLIVHLFICFAYFIFTLRSKNMQQSIYRLVVVFFLPVAGVLFFIVSGIFGRMLKETDNIEDNYEKYVKDDKQISYIQKIDFDNELNTIPLSDSLTLSNIKQRRSFLISLLKKDYTRYLKVLQKAVCNIDSETSHYACSALMEIKKQFEELLREKNKQYTENEGNKLLLMDYIDTVKKYLESGLPDQVERREISINLSYLLEKYLEKDHSSKQYYHDKINVDLELGNYNEAEKYGKYYTKYFFDDYEPYFELMKFFYETNNIKSIKKVLDVIKARKFNLDDGHRQLFDYWERQTESVH